MNLKCKLQAFLPVVLCCFVLCASASAQTYIRYVKPEDLGTKTLYADSVLTSITLPRGVARLNNYPKFNAAALELSQVLKDRTKELMQVWVCGSASPDGLWGDNVELSRARTDAAVAYLKSLMDIPEDKIHKESLNEDWDRLYELVEASDIPYKYDVLNIIRTKTWGERKTALQKLDGGKVWKILEKDFFPQLRCVRFAIYCRWDPSKPYLTAPVEPQEEEVTVISDRPDTVYIRDTVYYVKNTVYVNKEEPVTRQDAYDAYRSANNRPKKIYDTPWYMALKTDLATDVVALPQAGIEIQLSRKLSFGIDGWYSKWAYINPSKDFKVYGFRPDIRYYSKGVMEKGGFVGIHANLTWYTLMAGETLYQNATLCEKENCSVSKHFDYADARYHDNPPAWSVGLTLGYLQPLDRKNRWALEFVAGLGYGQYSQVAFKLNDDKTALSPDGITYAPTKGYAGITRVGINLRYRFSVRPYRK